MVDDTQPGAGLAVSICPWCSASYTGDPETCPSCGAALTVDPATDPALPGLTAIDPAAIVRAKDPIPKQRSRLLSWISGDYGEDALSGVEAAALALPDADVRREMLRLELEAEVANLQAEADSLMADASLEAGAIVGTQVAPVPDVADVTPGSETVAAVAAGTDGAETAPTESPGDEARPV